MIAIAQNKNADPSASSGRSVAPPLANASDSLGSPFPVQLLLILY
eukprot:SAG31_NODE_22131_length_533_cov_0.785714_1_plen_44_part_01